MRKVIKAYQTLSNMERVNQFSRLDFETQSTSLCTAKSLGSIALNRLWPDYSAPCRYFREKADIPPKLTNVKPKNLCGRFSAEVVGLVKRTEGSAFGLRSGGESGIEFWLWGFAENSYSKRAKMLMFNGRGLDDDHSKKRDYPLRRTPFLRRQKEVHVVPTAESFPSSQTAAYKKHC